MSNPRMAAHLDWALVGAFTPEQFSGDERNEYEDEARKIEREFDSHD
ncbi:hypothetical protein [Pseudomonas bohemica]|nr:hypothetical protein [Pseudomonas bohemica]